MDLPPAPFSQTLCAVWRHGIPSRGAAAFFANLIVGVSHNYRLIQYHVFDAAASFTGEAEAVTKMRELAQGPQETWIRASARRMANRS
jgi:hypothetical protein